VGDGTFRGAICFEVHSERYNRTDRDLRSELEFLFSAGYGVEAVTSADESEGLLAARGYRPQAVVRTHATRSRGIYRGVRQHDVLDLVCGSGGIRDLLLALPRG
jgi:hypothetical protein